MTSILDSYEEKSLNNIAINVYNIFVFPFAILSIGAPINSLWKFIPLIVSFLILLIAKPRYRHSRSMSCAALLALSLIAAAIPLPTIEEGENAFLPGYPQDAALAEELPKDVYATALQMFTAAHPPENNCSEAVNGCWRHEIAKPRSTPLSYRRAFALSADGLWDNPKYSRHRNIVEFDDIGQLRAGFVNKEIYRWYDYRSDIMRSRMPFITLFELDRAYDGGTLCWRGTVFLVDGEQVMSQDAPSRVCQTLVIADRPLKIYGLSATGIDLGMSIKPSSGKLALIFTVWAVRGLLTVGILLFFFAPCRFRLGMICAISTIAFVMALRYDPDNHIFFRATLGSPITAPLAGPAFTSYPPMPPDFDGLTHESFGRDILDNFREGRISQGLKGGEPIFYYMPGMRYLTALSLSIFGDSYFGEFLIAIMLPLILLYFLCCFFSRIGSLILLFLFLAGPAIITWPFIMGIDSWLYIICGHWPDATGAIMLFGGLAILIRQMEDLSAPAMADLVFAGLLISLSIILRPNFALPAALALAIIAWQMRRTLSPARLAAAILSLAPVGLLALHNWLFGHEFVLLTSAVHVNLSAPPTAWASALGSLVGLTAPDDAARTVVLNQIDTWLGDYDVSGVFPGFRHLAFVGMRLLGLLCLVAAPFYPRLRAPKYAAIIAAAFGAQLVLLFFVNTGRYGFIAWPLTGLITLSLFREIISRGIGRPIPSAANLSHDEVRQGG